MMFGQSKFELTQTPDTPDLQFEFSLPLPVSSFHLISQSEFKLVQVSIALQLTFLMTCFWSIMKLCVQVTKLNSTHNLVQNKTYIAA